VNCCWCTNQPNRYCSPKYDFPAQKEVVAFAVEKSLDAMHACSATVVVCGSYTIGKERVFTGVCMFACMFVCVHVCLCVCKAIEKSTDDVKIESLFHCAIELWIRIDCTSHINYICETIAVSMTTIRKWPILFHFLRSHC